MNRLHLLALGTVVTLITACGGSNPTSPSPTTSSSPQSFSLSGQVTATSGGVLSGVTVRIADGPNAGRSTTTDVSGNYTLTGLTQSGFTVQFSAANVDATSRGVTLTSNQVLNVQVAAYANMVGSWLGSYTSSGLGGSGQCNMTWLITSQTAGVFNGTYQVSGATGCSQAGNISGTMTTQNTLSAISLTIGVSNGAVCSDANVQRTSLLSGRVLTIQSTFVRTCTFPPPTITFNLSQTTVMTKQ